MRITFLLPSDNLTGGTRVVAVYARKLAELGHDVLVVTCAPDRLSAIDLTRALLKRDLQKLRKRGKPEPGHIALSGVAHKVLDKPRAIEARDVPDADVIVATWWETALWMHEMPWSKGRKVHLIQGYEVWPNPELTDRVHFTLKLPNLKIAISSDLKRTIESHVGNLDICVIPNAVDLEQFDATARVRRPAPTVGFVYAIAAFKGADICIRACELARREIPDLKVVAFGADLPSAELPLPAGTDYFHRPPQREIGTIYSSCDTWLFGSRHDSFGLPILEAMACRTPVIGVPIGAAPELLGDGTGTLVAMDSPEEMASAIVASCRLTEDEWKERSARAHAKAHSYSWNDATERLLQLLEA
jgi:glycosyltransferase involved in cell wall biosynthesis